MISQKDTGNCTDRHDDHPVSGISWYETVAYAEYAGKELPVADYWVMEKFTFDSAYDNQRMIVFLFLQKNTPSSALMYVILI